MSFLLVLSYTRITSGCIMFLLYIANLVLIYNGNKNRWLIRVVLTLLVSTIAMAMWGVMAIELFYNNHYTKLNITLFCLAFGTQVSTFNVSHYMLASRYQHISKVMPSKLEGKPEPVPT